MIKGKRVLLLSALVLVLLFSFVSVAAGGNGGQGTSLEGARQALEQELLARTASGFVGIADSDADGAIIVFVEDEQAKQTVPRSFDGYDVRTQVTGKIEAWSAQAVEPLAGVSGQRRNEVRPLVGGTSLSAYAEDWSHVYAGTLGMVTYDDKILTAAHVIAMDPDTDGFLDTGSPVIQPGTADGGGLSDQVGELDDYIPINFTPGAINHADAATGSIDGGVDASAGKEFSEGGSYWIDGWTTVSTGDTVRKSGRTTGVTTGAVNQTDATVMVSYGSQSALFKDVIVVSQVNYSFSQPGDSGAAVDEDGKFVGLLFAGSANTAVICKAQYIIDGLGISVENPGNSLTVSSTPGGSVITPSEETSFYDPGTVVDLSAVADEHYHFTGWTGDVGTVANVGSASTTVTMNGDYKITANFALDPGWYSLTVAGTPGGTVTAPPGEGTFVYPAGSNISLVAEADVGNHYHFKDWTGDTSTVGNLTIAETTIVMNDSYSITANFELDAGWHSLTISSTDGGSVTDPGIGLFVYPDGEYVGLFAQPDGDYQFVQWTGNVGTILDSDVANTTIIMNDSYSITANFQSVHPQAMAQLMVSSTSGGSVAIPGEGTFSYPLGQEVALVAEPANGYQFTGWSGNVSTIADAYSASTTITMDNSYSVIANFSGSGSGCFVTAATFGTPMAGQIQVLRDFRDEYLMTNPIGQVIVDLYYSVSPPIAAFITDHPGLKPVVRAGLSPAVTVSTVAVNTTSDERIVIAGLLVLALAAVAVWAMRWRARDSGPYLKAKQNISA